MRLLDLFCGAGGAAMGYHRAGFNEIIGVDINPQPRYPFTFFQADAMEFPFDGFDAIHASPPCQHYSVTKILHTNTHPDLYGPVKELLNDSGIPWVIENVIGAPYNSGIVLCGSMFGLGVWRHRNFETNFGLIAPSCQHNLVPFPIDVTASGGPAKVKAGRHGHRKPINMEHASKVMGIDWMTRREISQAIPPAYTEFIGKYLIAKIKDRAALYRKEVRLKDCNLCGGRGYLIVDSNYKHGLAIETEKCAGCKGDGQINLAV